MRILRKDGTRQSFIVAYFMSMDVVKRIQRDFQDLTSEMEFRTTFHRIKHPHRDRQLSMQRRIFIVFHLLFNPAGLNLTQFKTFSATMVAASK